MMTFNTKARRGVIRALLPRLFMLSALVAVTAPAGAEDNPDQLPASVRETIAALYPDAGIDQVETSTYTVHTVDLRVGRQIVTLTFSPDGAIDPAAPQSSRSRKGGGDDDDDDDDDDEDDEEDDDDDDEDDEDCECDGKVTELTLRNEGPGGYIKVWSKKNGYVFEGDVDSGEEFSFVGIDKKGTLGTEIWIFVNHEFHTAIHTSCSQPIGIGLVFGDFVVTEGASRNGGSFCPPPGDDDDDDCECRCTCSCDPPAEDDPPGDEDSGGTPGRTGDHGDDDDDDDDGDDNDKRCCCCCCKNSPPDDGGGVDRSARTGDHGDDDDDDDDDDRHCCCCCCCTPPDDPPGDEDDPDGTPG